MIATLYALGPWTQGPQTEQRKTTEVYAVPVLEASSPNSSVAESCSLKDSSKRSFLPLQLLGAPAVPSLVAASSLGHSSASPPFLSLMRTSLALRPTWIIQSDLISRSLILTCEDPFIFIICACKDGCH